MPTNLAATRAAALRALELGSELKGRVESLQKQQEALAASVKQAELIMIEVLRKDLSSLLVQVSDRPTTKDLLAVQKEVQTSKIFEARVATIALVISITAPIVFPYIIKVVFAGQGGD